MGRKLKSEPKPKSDNPDVLEVEAEGFGADMHREQYERFSEGRASMLVPDLPFLKKKDKKVDSENN